MPAPTNTSFATATSLGTITATSSTAVPVTQRVDDSGTTYTVYYSFTASTTVTGIFAFGDLTTYFTNVTVYDATQTQLSGIQGINVPLQIPTTVAALYYIVINPNFGNPTPANLTLTAYVAPAESVPVGSFAVNDDDFLENVQFPLGLFSSTADYTALKFLPAFPAGEAGDVLVNGTSLLEGRPGGAYLYNAGYQQLASLTGLGSSQLRIRTCLGGNNFYLGQDTNPSWFRTVSATGTFSSATNLTGMTSMAALAASNDQATLYHAFTGNNVAIRQWTIGVGAAANLAAGIASYAVTDILVLGDDSIVVGYWKSTVTRDFKVLRYNAAGSTLNTYTFATPASSPIPRMAYAIDDPNSFWVMSHSSTIPGQSNFFNVKVSDGSVLTTRNHLSFEQGVYQGTATATPLADFGPSSSCPFWITRVAQSATQTIPIRRQRRFLLPSSEDNKRIQIPVIELLMRTGIGLTPDAWNSDANSPQGANPKVLVRLSKDGGATWGKERSISAGKIGQYLGRVRLLQATGMYRNAVLEVTTSDPVDYQFLSAMAPNGILEGGS